MAATGNGLGDDSGEGQGRAARLGGAPLDDVCRDVALSIERDRGKIRRNEIAASRQLECRHVVEEIAVAARGPAIPGLRVVRLRGMRAVARMPGRLRRCRGMRVPVMRTMPAMPQAHRHLRNRRRKRDQQDGEQGQPGGRAMAMEGAGAHAARVGQPRATCTMAG